MNLYLLTQSENDDYDTYDSCVVAAESEETAKTIHPSNNYCFIDGKLYWKNSDGSVELQETNRSGWPSTPDNVIVRLIGIAIEGTAQCVILASFNAG